MLRSQQNLVATICMLAIVAVASAESILIRNVTIIDVEAGKARPEMSVFIKGDRIAQIGRADDLEPPADTTVVDGTGKFLMPGLFDGHVHFTAGMDVFGRLLIAHGVTAARDTGGPTEISIDLRNRAVGETVLPDLFVTGAIVDGDPPVWPFSEACATPEDARRAVNKLAEVGVDQIKVYSRLTPEAYRAAIDAATERGLLVTGHVPMDVPLREAIGSGQDCIEHFEGFAPMLLEMASGEKPERGTLFGGFTGWSRLADVDRDALRAVLKTIADAGIMQCPTIIVMKSLSRIADDSGRNDPRVRYVPSTLRDFWNGPQYERFARFAEQAVRPMQTLLAEMHAAGVPLMIGTDLGNPYVFAGASVHEEMQLFREAGIPDADVLRMATVVPARFCGAGDRLGTIEAGKIASMVLLRENPLEDISHVGAIDGVFLRGRYHDRDALDTMLAEVESTVRETTPTETEIDFDLPGDVVARGRFRMTFQQWDAGIEDFLITRDEEGFHVHAHTQPRGGGQTPSITTLHIEHNGELLRATWATQTAQSLTATYELEGNTITATARRGDDPEAPQHFERPERSLFSTPSYAGIFATLRAAALQPGEQGEYQAVGFGYPSWRVSATPYTLSRGDDETITIGEREIDARQYEATLETPMGAFNYLMWTDQHDVLMRMQMKMPFGAMAVERVDLAEDAE